MCSDESCIKHQARADVHQCLRALRILRHHRIGSIDQTLLRCDQEYWVRRALSSRGIARRKLR